MKTKVNNYIFSASAKTITFGDYAAIELERILLITNVTDNIIIYNFADSTKGGTVSGNVLTLAYDTSTMANSDKLLIYYDADEAKQRITSGDKAKEDLYQIYHFNATTTGTIVGVQGKRKLGYVTINTPGAAGSLVKIYDNYYQALSQDLKASIDGTVVGTKKYKCRLTQGCFLVISSTGAAPDVSISMA